MNIAFLVNDVDTEVSTATSTILAHAAVRRGHRVHVLGVRELAARPDGHVAAVARRGPGRGTRSAEGFLKAIQRKDAVREEVTSEDLDVLWLRYNPSQEVGDDAWARDAGILFGQIAARRGVLVLNDPETLSWAISKFYDERFPAEIRPRTLIARDPERIRGFYEECERRVVLKPVAGYGGADVYLVGPDATNLSQIVESISRQGYVIAQEFLPAAKDGDTRLFLVNGEPVLVDGKCAALRRVNPGEDFRANMTAGARPAPPELTDGQLEVGRIVGGRLRADGIFFAGIDLVGEKLVEVNTISAGGLNAAGKVNGVDFAPPVIEALERKVELRRQYGPALSNRILAGLG